MEGVGVAEGVVLSVIGLVYLWLWWRIFEKPGFSGWYCLLMAIPILNILMFLYLAFAEWPVRRDVHGSTSDAVRDSEVDGDEAGPMLGPVDKNSAAYKLGQLIARARHKST